MSFFRKLKDKLFSSSSKLEEGLEAIVEDGGVAEVEVEAAPQPAQPAVQQREPAMAGAAADMQAPPDPGPDLPPDPAPTPEPDPVPAPTPDPAPSPEPDPVPDPTPDPLPDPEPDPVPNPDPAPDPSPDPIPTPEPDPVPAPDPAPDIRPGQTPQEVPDRSPAEIPVQPDYQPDPGPMEIPIGIPDEFSAAAETTAADGARKGILGRLFGRGEQKTVIRRILDDAMVERLEELLIQSDMGVDTALRVAANMAEGRIGRKLSVDEIKDLLASEVARIMEPVARPMPLYKTRPQVVLVVGVNGSGKTTTIGKLASQFRAAGKSVVIAAGDTFRAAAVEQLQVWGDRAGVPVMTAPEGSDPASLAFDAMTKAQLEGADLLLIDTAGRLQNRADLMEELAKIVRVIRKKDPEAPHNTLLVLDATTGQNALSQVETFQKLADVSGIVMTKLDGTAKGGVLVALADRFGLPIHAIGVGEQIDDLQAFDPEDFARALCGLEAA